MKGMTGNIKLIPKQMRKVQKSTMAIVYLTCLLISNDPPYTVYKKGGATKAAPFFCIVNGSLSSYLQISKVFDRISLYHFKLDR